MGYIFSLVHFAQMRMRGLTSLEADYKMGDASGKNGRTEAIFYIWQATNGLLALKPPFNLMI